MYPEKVNAGRVGENNNMRRIGQNVNPGQVRAWSSWGGWEGWGSLRRRCARCVDWYTMRRGIGRQAGRAVLVSSQRRPLLRLPLTCTHPPNASSSDTLPSFRLVLQVKFSGKVSMSLVAWMDLVDVAPRCCACCCPHYSAIAAG